MSKEKYYKAIRGPEIMSIIFKNKIAFYSTLIIDYFGEYINLCHEDHNCPHIGCYHIDIIGDGYKEITKGEVELILSYI